jgi:hypothetical protein
MIQYLDEFIYKYNINKDDICIVGSFALECAGLRKANDIDIILRKEIRTQLKIPFIHPTKVNECVEVVAFGWAAFMDIDDNELIDNNSYHDYFNGYKIINLKILKRKKINLLRKKDIKDLKKMGVSFFYRSLLWVVIILNGISRRILEIIVKRYTLPV